MTADLVACCSAEAPYMSAAGRVLSCRPADLLALMVAMLQTFVPYQDLLYVL